jgi:proline iminopeptidase
VTGPGRASRRRWALPGRHHPRPSAPPAASGGRTLALRDGVEGKVTVAPGVKLWYRVVGDGPATIIVPVTGNDPEFGGLSVPGHRVLLYDVRSRGRSDTVTDPTRLGFSVEVTDLEAVRQSFGIERFKVLAWSYHAGVAATYAIQHPERVEAMVLAATIPVRAGTPAGPAREPAPHQLAELDQLEAAGLREADPAAFCRAWRAVYQPLLMGDPGAFERMAPVCAFPNEWPWNVARSLVHVFAQLRSYDWRPYLREVQVPTLVVHGGADRDPVEVVREWSDALPEGRLLELEGAGRFPWVERPEAFFAAVNRFLAGDRI